MFICKQLTVDRFLDLDLFLRIILKINRVHLNFLNIEVYTDLLLSNFFYQDFFSRYITAMLNFLFSLKGKLD